MIRKSCVLGAIFLFSTTSWATGFYAGAGVGPDFGNFKLNAHVKEQHGNLTGFDVIDKEQAAGTGVFGTLFAGYGKRASDIFPKLPHYLYLGGELNADASTLKHKNSNKEYVHQTFSSTSYRVENSVGVSVLPGYLYNDTTLFYARLGYSAGKFKVATSDVSLANVSKYLDGFRWGFGMQQTLTTQWSARVEFSQINYDTTRTSTFDPMSEVSKTTKFRPRTDEVEFGLSYHFC